MKSKVLEKVVLVTEDNEICFCDSEFRKTCIARIANNLPCLEMLVRLTPIERGVSTDCDDGQLPMAGSVDPELKHATSEFAKTLNHFKKMR